MSRHPYRVGRCLHPLRRRALHLAGFTLMELVVAMALLGVLAMVAMPMAELSWQRQREAQLRTALREIRTAIDAYKQAAEAGLVARTPGDTGYPPSLAVLEQGVRNQKDPKAGVLVFLRRVPRDPFAAETTATADQTWATRAYGSAPNDPREGRDVFDVASRSSRVGLNGIALREW